jgi:DNA-directed RNA polymerase specialized sigma24 family protein
MDQELFTKFLKGDDSSFSQLMRLHRYRVERLAESKGMDQADLVKKVTRSLAEQRNHIPPAPSFLHWLYLFTLKEIRQAQTGQTDFCGLFETAEEEFRPAQDFKHELNKYLEWMTDDKMEHYRMRFEDGLVFEEMAVLLPKPAASTTNSPYANWLEDWRVFLMEPKEQ